MNKSPGSTLLWIAWALMALAMAGPLGELVIWSMDRFTAIGKNSQHSIPVQVISAVMIIVWFLAAGFYKEYCGVVAILVVLVIANRGISTRRKVITALAALIACTVLWRWGVVARHSFQ